MRQNCLVKPHHVSPKCWKIVDQHSSLDFFAPPSGLKNAEPRAKAASLWGGSVLKHALIIMKASKERWVNCKNRRWLSQRHFTEPSSKTTSERHLSLKTVRLVKKKHNFIVLEDPKKTKNKCIFSGICFHFQFNCTNFWILLNFYFCY